MIYTVIIWVESLTTRGLVKVSTTKFAIVISWVKQREFTMIFLHLCKLSQSNIIHDLSHQNALLTIQHKREHCCHQYISRGNKAKVLISGILSLPYCPFQCLLKISTVQPAKIFSSQVCKISLFLLYQPLLADIQS